jgi:hypothetical protein
MNKARMSLRRDHFFNFGSFFPFSFMWGGNHHPPCPNSKLPQFLKKFRIKEPAVWLFDVLMMTAI